MVDSKIKSVQFGNRAIDLVGKTFSTFYCTEKGCKNVTKFGEKVQSLHVMQHVTNVLGPRTNILEVPLATCRPKQLKKQRPLKDSRIVACHWHGRHLWSVSRKKGTP